MRSWIAALQILMIPAACFAQASAPAAPACEKGYQPLAGRCISNRMSDYIGCVEASGGNQDSIRQIVITQSGQTRGGQGSIAGSGVVIAGKADAKVDTKSEFEMIDSIEKKFFPGGMSSCAQALPPVSKT